MTHIFVSYSRADGQPAAKRLRTELTQARLQVRPDIEAKEGGQTWKEKLREAIRSVDSVAILLTPKAITSIYTQWEWEQALALEKQIFPLSILPCDLPNDFKCQHCYNFSDERDYTTNLSALIGDLYSVSGTKQYSTSAREAYEPDGAVGRDISIGGDSDKSNSISGDRNAITSNNTEKNSNNRNKNQSDISNFVTVLNSGNDRAKKDVEEIKKHVETVGEIMKEDLCKIIQDMFSQYFQRTGEEHVSEGISRQEWSKTSQELSRKYEELQTVIIGSISNMDELLYDTNQEILSANIDVISSLQKKVEGLKDEQKLIDWIYEIRRDMAKHFGRKSLEEILSIEGDITPDKVGKFCFSIYQFLEQIAHCVKWGKPDILDSPGIPLVFNYPIYRKAFLLIKEFIFEKGMVEKNLPSCFSERSRDLALKYIDYLVFKLPSYERK